jgi:hypothetical protein
MDYAQEAKENKEKEKGRKKESVDLLFSGLGDLL